MEVDFFFLTLTLGVKSLMYEACYWEINYSFTFKLSSSMFVFQSLLDDHGLAEVTAVAKEIMDAINKNEYGLATELWSKAEGIIEEVRSLSSINKKSVSGGAQSFRFLFQWALGWCASFNLLPSHFHQYVLYDSADVKELFAVHHCDCKRQWKGQPMWALVWFSTSKILTSSNWKTHLELLFFFSLVTLHIVGVTS